MTICTVYTVVFLPEYGKFQNFVDTVSIPLIVYGNPDGVELVQGVCIPFYLKSITFIILADIDKYVIQILYFQAGNVQVFNLLQIRGNRPELKLVA